jgi:hypothetical protein
MPNKEMTRVQVLREFFYRPGKDTLSGFVAELKLLTADDRRELETLAAAQLGVTLKDV